MNTNVYKEPVKLIALDLDRTTLKSDGHISKANRQAVEYNICIDNSTEKTEYLSAFYRIFKGKDGNWQHDSCQEWYSHEIDFSDDNWKEKLEDAAIRAYKTLWED